MGGMPEPCTNSQDVAVAGPLRVISATAEALEEHTLRSPTGEPPHLVFYLHGLGRRAGGTITRLVRTILPPRCYGVMVIV